MTVPRPKSAESKPRDPDRVPVPDEAREVWAHLRDLVLDNERRREVAELVGLSFNRVRAIRRVARSPMSMREVASALGIDPPNATVVVDDLESLGLVRRRPHPTDRRAKLVEPTRKGKEVARRADAFLNEPPAALRDLAPADLEALAAILRRVNSPPRPPAL
jgi:DNA-binding MarR family transcriptional regulator